MAECHHRLEEGAHLTRGTYVGTRGAALQKETQFPLPSNIEAVELHAEQLSTTLEDEVAAGDAKLEAERPAGTLDDDWDAGREAELQEQPLAATLDDDWDDEVADGEAELHAKPLAATLDDDWDDEVAGGEAELHAKPLAATLDDDWDDEVAERGTQLQAKPSVATLAVEEDEAEAGPETATLEDTCTTELDVIDPEPGNAPLIDRVAQELLVQTEICGS
jgi:hypothetical protein